MSHIISKDFVKELLIRLSMVCSLCLLLASGASAQDGGGAKPSKETSFSKDVAPLLDKFCTTCHNEDEDHPSQLFMDSYESLMKGGKHGVAVKPGNSKESLLMMKMDVEPPFGKRMPPSKKLIPTAEQIEVIRKWIDEGAKKN
ncbi:MAG TPA: c-type cytochrome domain-containing protein [Bacteroidota bacterium]|nr:c-type cytochrome domain-containing protein [Bacteroidota bacterium]